VLGGGSDLGAARRAHRMIEVALVLISVWRDMNRAHETITWGCASAVGHRFEFYVYLRTGLPPIQDDSIQ
jgi:hypothetical protein